MNIKKYARAIGKYLSDSNYRFLMNAGLGKYNNLSDKEYLERKFECCMGKSLDLEHPQTFNEKLQWLKLYDRKPEYTTMVDKYAVKKYVADKIGEEYIIPTLGVWDNPDDIDFDTLPNKFVLKCNHNSGLGMCICKDKSKLNIENVKSELKKGLAQDYYLTGREWPYKNVPRKIIAEKYMTDTSDSSDFTDYKFFCFNGYVDCVMVCLERSSGDTKFYFFDSNWNLKRLNTRGKNAPDGFTISKPSQMDKMFEIAAKLSKGLPFVRIDLYQSNDHIYFGEITFFPDSGFDANLLPETDKYFGNLIHLEDVK